MGLSLYYSVKQLDASSILVEQFESPDSILIVNQRVKVAAEGGQLKDRKVRWQ